MLLLLILILLLFGGGWYGHQQYGGPGLIGVILLVAWILITIFRTKH